MNDFNEKEVKTALELFCGAHLTEIRLLGSNTKKTYSGYFKDFDNAVKQLSETINRAPGAQCYFLFNAPLDECYARKQHEKFYVVGEGETTKDNQMARRNWLLIDADPLRGTGKVKDISSTAGEKEASLKVINDVRSYLAGKGFPEPVFADSGNGYHLLYRIDMPNDQESGNIVENFIYALDFKFSTETVDIDKTVFNAARLCKLYGTLAKKGANTTDRPHRLSRLLNVPPNIEVTPTEKIKEIAEEFVKINNAIEEQKMAKFTPSPKARGSAKGRRITDPEEFMRKHGLEWTRVKTEKNLTIYPLRICPFDPAHVNCSCVTWNGETMGFNCFHNSCSGYNARDFIERMEPDFFAQKQSKTRQPRALTTTSEKDGAGNNADEADGGGGDWTDQLETTDSGKIKKCEENIKRILLNDEDLKKIWYNSFTGWDMTDAPEFYNVNGNFVDDESLGLIKSHIYKAYEIEVSAAMIDNCLTATRKIRARNPVKEYIEAKTWDGVPRIETLLVKYLGAADTTLTRAVTRKWMTAAVARVYEPGIKFDFVLTLAGPQGNGKSTFFRTISTDKWFEDSIKFDAGYRENAEKLVDAWIVEIPELNGLTRAEMTAVKSFITTQADSFRPAYARRKANFPRHCVLGASTNEAHPLQGNDGNRRFWIVDCPSTKPPTWSDELAKNVPQIWAEACVYYNNKEKLYIDSSLEREMLVAQAQHNSVMDDDLRPIIEEYLDTPIPIDFYCPQFTLFERRQFFATHGEEWQTNTRQAQRETRLRKYVCAQEVINELPDNRIRSSAVRSSTARVNGILESLEGWQLIQDSNRRMPGASSMYAREGKRVKKLFIRAGQPDDWDMFCGDDAAVTTDNYTEEECPF